MAITSQYIYTEGFLELRKAFIRHLVVFKTERLNRRRGKGVGGSYHMLESLGNLLYVFSLYHFLLVFLIKNLKKNTLIKLP